VVIVEELLALAVLFAAWTLLYASIIVFTFGVLWWRRATLKMLAACSIALYAIALLAAVRSWMGGELAGAWGSLALGAFYSALAATILLAVTAAVELVGRWLERRSPENAKRFQKALLIAFIVSAIAAMIVSEISRR
jgi:uncharacterized protein YqgC (DUF456 family)